MRVDAVLVAAGRGERAPSVPVKVLTPLGGRPLLARSLALLEECPAIHTVVLVAPRSLEERFREEAVLPFGFTKVARIVAGGPERQDSVRIGLEAVEEAAEIVVVHDAARPFATQGTLSAVIEGAREFGAAIPVVPLEDTVKKLAPVRPLHLQGTVERHGLVRAQTPQAFQARVLRKAHEEAVKSGFRGTDDASLVERIGRPVRVVDGDRLNFKITWGEDLWIAEGILLARERAAASGEGGPAGDAERGGSGDPSRRPSGGSDRA